MVRTPERQDLHICSTNELVKNGTDKGHPLTYTFLVGQSFPKALKSEFFGVAVTRQ